MLLPFGDVNCKMLNKYLVKERRRKHKGRWKEMGFTTNLKDLKLREAKALAPSHTASKGWSLGPHWAG